MKKLPVIAFIIFSSFALLSWRGETVTATAEKFLNGLYHLDIPAAKSVATPETQKQLDSYREMLSFVQDSGRVEMAKTQIVITDTRITGDHAVVSYKVITPEDNSLKSLKLVQIDGDWKVTWSKIEATTDGNQPVARDTTTIAPPSHQPVNKAHTKNRH